MNKRNLRLSLEAERSLNEIVAYTRKQWGSVELKHLRKRIKTLFDVIKSNPEAFKIYEDNDHVRKAILINDISVFYKIKDSRTVEVVLFWNNSRDPSSLPL